MADIFLSYSSTDRTWASDFAEILGARGWSVFWDRRIPVGKQYDQVIERELEAARCVIVLWSRSSVSSNWVKEEAEEGARRGVLCPVLIEDVRVPLGMRRFQTARLVGWKPGSPHAELDQLMNDVGTALTRHTSPGDAPPERQTLVGTLVQNFRVTSLLGEGGMGAVYRAEHRDLQRQVAIKVLRREYAEDAQVVDRFINEAKAASAMRHPGIVEVFDVGMLRSGLPYLVMELLAGETVRARMGRARLSVAQAVDIARQTAGALAAAHDKGIVHRDIKPENLFLVPDGPGRDRVKVLDFGIAKLTATGLVTVNDSNRTKTGAVMGTPPYMSPEQCRGAGGIDHRTDVYALGIILFEMLTGEQPFRGEGFGDIMMLHMTARPPSPRALNTAIPPEIEAAILRALQKDPDDRFQRMADFASALGGDTLQEVEPPAVVAGGTQVMAAGGTKVMPPPVSRPTPTTMTGAASELGTTVLPARGPPRRVLVGGAAVLGLVVVIGIGRYLWPSAVPMPDERTTTGTTTGTGTGGTVAVTGQGGATAPPLEKYRIEVRVQPADASIELDGRPAGKSPFAREMLADGKKHTLRFSRKGYAGQEIPFADATTVPAVITLARLKIKPKPPEPGDLIDRSPPR